MIYYIYHQRKCYIGNKLMNGRKKVNGRLYVLHSFLIYFWSSVVVINILFFSLMTVSNLIKNNVLSYIFSTLTMYVDDKKNTDYFHH